MGGRYETLTRFEYTVLPTSVVNYCHTNEAYLPGNLSLGALFSCGGAVRRKGELFLKVGEKLFLSFLL